MFTFLCKTELPLPRRLPLLIGALIIGALGILIFLDPAFRPDNDAPPCDGGRRPPETRSLQPAQQVLKYKLLKKKTRWPWGGRVGAMGWPRDVYGAEFEQTWKGLGGLPLFSTFAEIAERVCLLASCNIDLLYS